MAEYSNQAYRHTLAAMNREENGIPEFLSDPPTEDVATQAGKEADDARRSLDETLEGMRSRQRYFFEKAQLHEEAATHFRRLSEDIADLLNNDFVNKADKKDKGQIIREGYGG
jgi:hypothetical protein